VHGSHFAEEYAAAEIVLPLMRLLLPFCIALAGCSAMTESECRSTDWYERGRLDARVYAIQPAISQYARQCAPYGVQAAEARYMEGWRVGYGEWNTGGRM
jgi:hypothetical protein